MGQAGGLADYWAVFGAEDGLQGGFVWEWADHGLRRTDADGSTWFAYGGDFGEELHDASFVCDGLVSPDRVPHPLLGELAALGEPVVVRATAGGGRLTIENRRWFTGVDDLEARWTSARDGRVVARGRLELPAIGPRSSVDVPNPVGRAAGGRWAAHDDDRGGAATPAGPGVGIAGMGRGDVVRRARRHFGAAAGAEATGGDRRRRRRPGDRRDRRRLARAVVVAGADRQRRPTG